MAAADATPPLVLLVDDSEDNREVYAQYLSFSGVRVESAVERVEVVVKAALLQPDVIVIDLSVPRVDGWVATVQIKTAPATSGIAVITLTGHAVSQSKLNAVDVECSGAL